MENRPYWTDGRHDNLVDDIVLGEEFGFRVVFRRIATPEGMTGAIIRQPIEGEQRSDLGGDETRIGISGEGLRGLVDYLLEPLLAEDHPRAGIGTAGVEVVGIKVSEETVKNITEMASIPSPRLVSHKKGHVSLARRLLGNFDSDSVESYVDDQEYRRRCRVVSEMSLDLEERGKGEAHWQKFFEDNCWILEQHAFIGPVAYLNGESLLGGKNTEGRAGSGGVSADHLFMDQSSKSFAVVEIKTPATQLVGAAYRGRGTDSQIFSPHTELSGALVQAQKQLKIATEYFAGYLGKSYQDEDLNCLHPQSVLVIGNLGNLNDQQIASFNLFRRSIYPTTIVTYDEILVRLKSIYQLDLDNM